MTVCPKCRSLFIQKAYDRTLDVLNFRCMGCGYWESQKPADAKPSEREKDAT